MEFCSTDIKIFKKSDLCSYFGEIYNKHIVLFLTKSGETRWNIQEDVNALCQNNFVYKESVSVVNPNQSDIIRVLWGHRSRKPDLLLAIGGGSMIDLAKAVSALWDSYRVGLTEKELSEIIDKKQYFSNAFIPIIAIPTTAGTGSELTQWATVWDRVGNKKRSLDHPGLKPFNAIIIYEFLYSLPKRILLSTTLDALSHAMESFWSKAGNDLIQDIALKAIELIVNHLKTALLGDSGARDCLMRASLLSGLAFSQTRTTACHAISYPLTAQFGMEHGFAVSVSLDAVYQINKKVVPRYREIDAVFQPYGGLKSWIKYVCEGIVTMNLHAFGVNAEDVSLIVKDCFTPERMGNNPVALTEEDVTNILEECLFGE